ncbi:hypothetical protein [Psychroserpens sp.]|uniref:hypothetical protein n=1 Tax=Psychroserpens sp. TaxID=2020870 RepID=UPI003C718A41
MLIFCIPLRSKEVSKDWNKVSLLFNRTLESVYNQTNQNFKIFVACHQIPTLSRTYDDRVEFIKVETEIPVTYMDMMWDKDTKIYTAQNAARRFLLKQNLTGAYFMNVDSDDLISNKIAEFVETQATKKVYTSKYGFIYFDGRSYMKKARRLERTCGSCFVIHLDIAQLPHNNLGFLENDVDKCPFTPHHSDIMHKLTKIKNWEHGFIPFPTTIYIVNDVNVSNFANHQIGRNRRIEYKLERRRKISKYEDIFNIKSSSKK